MAGEPDDVFYSHLIRELARGRLTPFLGAGVNLVGIEAGQNFTPGARLPSSAELAATIADEFDYPTTDRELDLVRVAQWVYSSLGSDALYDSMHSIFDHDFPANPLHDAIAGMPELVRAQPRPEYPLIITTNYDDALERAFMARGEPFDVLTYVAAGEDIGLFRHTDEAGTIKTIKSANRYRGVTLTERSAILKLHGAVKRESSYPIEDDSYVVSEDDYIECLTRTEIVGYLPPAVARRMHGCHYLFLGYSLRDWNLRAMLRRIWRERARQNKSWAIVTNPDPHEVLAWKDREVTWFDIDLARFAARLESEFASTRDRDAVT